MTKMKRIVTMNAKDELSVKELVKFVDDNFRPLTWREVFKTSRLITAMFITIIVLLVYLVGLSPFTPITNQIPMAIAFTALLLAALSVTRVLRREIQTSLTNYVVESMYPKLSQKDERTKYLVYALVFMKIMNQHLKLTTLYEINKSLFDTEKLLARLYD